MPNPVKPRARGAPRTIEEWLERETRIAAATRPLRQALAQSEHYTDLRGQQHQLARMTAAEAALALGLLERYAGLLHRGALGEYLLRPYPRRRGQEALDEAHRQLAALSAADWLHRRPLYRALKQRASQ